jgi:hypothetical protein
MQIARWALPLICWTLIGADPPKDGARRLASASERSQSRALVGYSVRHFDGDSLVVETAGFSDVSWLDDPGHPHTDALRVIERFRRKDFRHMEIQITIDDPKAYTKPWTVTENFDFFPDTELLENVCENEKDAVHLMGK